MILAELHGLREEMIAMHQETHATLVALRELFTEIRLVESNEAGIEEELGLMANRLGDALDDKRISLTSCSVCGSNVERHAAENGILLICKACGHTAFADRRTGTERRNDGGATQEGPDDQVTEGIDWTRAET
jgi:NADH pyrophosphatase NudC (nudix superfamily)